MGKQVSSFKFVGKFGNAVGFKDRKNVISVRQRPEVVRNPNTPAQQKARCAFLAATSLAAAFKKALAGFGPYAAMHHMSLRNAFVAANHKYVEYSEGLNGGVDAFISQYSKVELSEGTLEGVHFSGARFDEALTIKANFQNVGAISNGVVYLVAWAPEVSELAVAVAEVDDGTMSMNVPSGWNGLTVHVWGYTLGFADEMQKVKYLTWWNGGVEGPGGALTEIKTIEANLRASKTTYIGNGTIA